MSRIEYIKKAGCCRRCLNKLYNLNLKRGDVLVYNYEMECRRCKKVSRIVYTVKPKAYWKLLMMKKK